MEVDQFSEWMLSIECLGLDCEAIQYHSGSPECVQVFTGALLSARFKMLQSFWIYQRGLKSQFISV